MKSKKENLLKFPQKEISEVTTFLRHFYEEKDKNSEKKYLEIYSDLPRPLLTEFSFFNGLSGGKLFLHQ